MTSYMDVPLMLQLTPERGSFPFAVKQIPFSALQKRLQLGVVQQSTRHLQNEHTPSPSNGWFSAIPNHDEDDEDDEESGNANAGPIPVSVSHADLHMREGRVYISDLDSAFGTFVNDSRIRQTSLKSGDVIRLGSAIRRNRDTPAYITDNQLKPIIARVNLVAGTRR